MRRNLKNCLLIGDSNFIYKKKLIIEGIQKNFCIGELIEHKLKKINVNVVNVSVFGDTLLDVYQRITFKNHILKINPKFIFLGLGTNDSNYYYSLGRFIMSPELHYELLKSIIETLINIYPKAKIYILPVPQILLNYNHDLSMKRNSQIDLFNQMRSQVSKNHIKKVTFLNEFKINPKKDLDLDGIHFNKSGISFLSEKISSFIIEQL